MQGPVGILPQAWGRVHVNHRAALLPHVPGGTFIYKYKSSTDTHIRTLRVVTANPFALRQFIQQNTEGADTDEKPCEADGKGISILKPSFSVTHTVQKLSSMHFFSCHNPNRTYASQAHLYTLHMRMHNPGAPVINCDCSGFPANLLCVAFN